MTCYLFPGQGSQVKGMGGELFDEFPDVTDKTSSILGYCIKTLCLQDPDNQLDLTRYTQAAVYTVNALHYLKLDQPSTTMPNYFMGHSLGEFNALQVAGAFDFEQGLQLVKKRGELMHELGAGSMAAVMGLSEIKLKQTLIDLGLDTLDIANFNAPQQLVVSGKKSDIDQLVESLQSDTVKCVKLNTSGAFHSVLMKKPADEFSEFLNGVDFKQLSHTVIANLTALPYCDAEIRSTLSKQMTHPVLRSKSIEYLLELGERNFIEVGGTDVLTKLVEKTQRHYTNAQTFSKSLDDFAQAFA